MAHKKLTRIWMIAIISMVGVFVILGGYFIWKQQEVIVPLEHYLTEHELIRNFDINEGDNRKLEIMLEFNYKPFLNEPYEELKEELNRIVGDETWSIKFIDHRNSQLKEANHHLRFMLWHRYQDEDYQNIMDNLEELSNRYSLDHIQVHLSDLGFLIQMKQGESFLVELFNYPSALSRGDQ